MAAVTSTFKNPESTFVWWIEGDKIAIATTQFVIIFFYTVHKKLTVHT